MAMRFKSVRTPDGKVCSKCGRFMLNDQYYKCRHTIDGLKNQCKVCDKEYTKATKQDRKNRMRQRNLSVNFDLTQGEYQALYDAQGGVCAICGQPETSIHKGSGVLLAIDHDHDTGKIRGLLCRHCNLGLGSFNDEPERLQGAIDYLRESKDRQDLRLEVCTEPRQTYLFTDE